MPTFQDSAFIFFLALLLFGPKKLPELARYVGKLMAEFRRASNEFRTQMEDELRIADQVEQQKKIAAISAAAPLPPVIGQDIPEPEHPHLEPLLMPTEEPAAGLAAGQAAEEPVDGNRIDSRIADAVAQGGAATPGGEAAGVPAITEIAAAETAPLPIATSGGLNLMPPATGLPVARSAASNGQATQQVTRGQGDTHSEANPLSGLFDSIPQTADPAAPENEPSTHV